jgi:predicted nucleic acid-binding Zn ribbon protein
MEGRCPNCGAAVEEGTKYCPKCGESLVAAKPRWRLVGALSASAIPLAVAGSCVLVPGGVGAYLFVSKWIGAALFVIGLIPPLMFSLLAMGVYREGREWKRRNDKR